MRCYSCTKSLKGDTYFLELFFAPRPQSSSSTLAWDCCAAAALAAAASAFCALPETFLPFSPKFFLPAMVMKGCVLVICLGAIDGYILLRIR